MDNKISSKWLAYYTDHFSNFSDDSLTHYWNLYGRESEKLATSREMAAWAAVNQEMQHRGIDA